jgi:hypothetical protein
MGTPPDAAPEPGGHGNSGHLAVVIATALPNARTTEQIMAGLAALALALAHDVVIRKR